MPKYKVTFIRNIDQYQEVTVEVENVADLDETACSALDDSKWKLEEDLDMFISSTDLVAED